MSAKGKFFRLEKPAINILLRLARFEITHIVICSILFNRQFFPRRFFFFIFLFNFSFSFPFVNQFWKLTEKTSQNAPKLKITRNLEFAENIDTLNNKQFLTKRKFHHQKYLQIFSSIVRIVIAVFHKAIVER